MMTNKAQIPPALIYCGYQIKNVETAEFGAKVKEKVKNGV